MKAADFDSLAWVELSYVDVFGTRHSMQLPASRFQAALIRGEPFDGSSLEGRTRLVEIDMRLRPDPATLVQMRSGVGRAVCTVLDKDGRPWPADPRTALSMVVEQCGALGADYSISAELEFYLLDEDLLPIDRGSYFDEAQGIGMSVVREAADRLIACGVEIDSLHHEAGPGQYEIDLAFLKARDMADALVLAKQVLHDTAADHGLQATFMPRPLLGEAGSGMHVHQRLGWSLVDEDGQVSEQGRAFLAGQLAHGRALTALAAPTVNSYKRLHSGPEAPSSAVWAYVNRGALVRLSPNHEGGPTFEFRASDPSANPYLLFAGLLAAGADGMISELELPPAFEEELGGFDPASMDSARSEPLPRELDDALDALLTDDVLVDTFDTQLLSRLVDGRRAEASSYRAQVTSWEIEQYLDEA
jgi:glutamine synthetase